MHANQGLLLDVVTNVPQSLAVPSASPRTSMRHALQQLLEMVSVWTLNG